MYRFRIKYLFYSALYVLGRSGEGNPLIGPDVSQTGGMEVGDAPGVRIATCVIDVRSGDDVTSAHTTF